MMVLKASKEHKDIISCYIETKKDINNKKYNAY
jgi:hypothetical protein